MFPMLRVGTAGCCLTWAVLQISFLSRGPKPPLLILATKPCPQWQWDGVNSASRVSACGREQQKGLWSGGAASWHSCMPLISTPPSRLDFHEPCLTSSQADVIPLQVCILLCARGCLYSFSLSQWQGDTVDFILIISWESCIIRPLAALVV